MKKSIWIICFWLLLVNASSGQVLPKDSITDKVTFKLISQFDSTYTADVLYNISKDWLATNTSKFNIANGQKGQAAEALFGIKKANTQSTDALYKNDAPLVMQDIESKKLIGKCVIKYNGSTFGCIRVMYLQCDIKISIKQNKIKSEITNFSYTNYNQVTMQQMQLAGWKDEGFCSSKGEIEGLLKCIECRDLLDLFKFLREEMNILQSDLPDYVKKNKGTEDDW